MHVRDRRSAPCIDAGSTDDRRCDRTQPRPASIRKITVRWLAYRLRHYRTVLGEPEAVATPQTHLRYGLGAEAELRRSAGSAFMVA